MKPNLTEINRKIKITQRDSIKDKLAENQVAADPFLQFITWFEQVLASSVRDPSAMILATVDKNGYPDTRVVLLKELAPHQFVFYTGYQSNKGKQLAQNNKAAINFYWPNFTRQVRMRGDIEKVPREQGEKYFATRSREAQLGTHTWVQSSVISDREEIDNKLKKVEEKFANKKIPCPENWGGYMFKPFEYEFFQGRDGRMHDRLLYTLRDGGWKISRLAP